MKVTAGGECAPQLKFVVCDLNIKYIVERKVPFVLRRKIWKLKDSENSDSFCTHFTQTLDKLVYAHWKTDVESKWPCW